MKSEILAILKKNRDSFVSGEEISRLFGITRAAVWKIVRQLESQGYLIESVPNNGYKLKGCPDILTSDEIGEYLRTGFIGRKIVHLDSVDSTNRKAKELAEAGEAEGTVVVSEAQTSGKGKAGRNWASEAYRGIWMSVILRPAMELTSLPLMTQIACAAVGKAVEGLVPVQVKWPNDVLIGGKKFCGVLTESSGEVDQVDYIILGVGINVNQGADDFPEALRERATSLKIETQKQISRQKLMCEILNTLEEYYVSLIKQGDAEGALAFCRERSSIIGRQILLKRNGREIRAKAVGINREGQLTIRTGDGALEAVGAGDVVPVVSMEAQ